MVGNNVLNVILNGKDAILGSTMAIAAAPALVLKTIYKSTKSKT